MLSSKPEVMTNHLFLALSICQAPTRAVTHENATNNHRLSSWGSAATSTISKIATRINPMPKR